MLTKMVIIHPVGRIGKPFLPDFPDVGGRNHEKSSIERGLPNLTTGRKVPEVVTERAR